MVSARTYLPWTKYGFCQAKTRKLLSSAKCFQSINLKQQISRFCFSSFHSKIRSVFQISNAYIVYMLCYDVNCMCSLFRFRLIKLVAFLLFIFSLFRLLRLPSPVSNIQKLFSLKYMLHHM